MRERAEEALARHGRARPDFPLCVYTTVRMDDDVADRRARDRPSSWRPTTAAASTSAARWGWARRTP